jgi:hypothetical protein
MLDSHAGISRGLLFPGKLMSGVALLVDAAEPSVCLKREIETRESSGGYIGEMR